jgi:hypothetical protein
MLHICPQHSLQVQYPNLPQSVLAAAERMGGGKAKPALQLVGYAHEVEAAMKYAFGGAFVCEVGGVTPPDRLDPTHQSVGACWTP